jgi:hypothetical protein
MHLQIANHTIETEAAPNPRAAAIDAANRSREAESVHAAFFNSRDHQHKIAVALDVVDNFFRVRKGVYVNHRVGRKQPFTVVKVDNPNWPRVSNRRADQEWRQPLAAIGAETVFSKRTNSYLIRIY